MSLRSPSWFAAWGGACLCVWSAGGLCQTASAQSGGGYLIATVAGNGTQGYSGDGGPATSAQMSYPYGVTVDSTGNLYIAEQGNNCIRKVSNGVITTVAGNGTRGFSGDNGPATTAELNQPLGVAVDSAGNVYIADEGNNRIRKVSNGVITTVAGNGTQGQSGDGGPATGAELVYPSGIAVDSVGNLYIADSGNARLWKVSNGVITTVAGNGTGGFSGDGGPATSAEVSPSAVAVDSVGNLYIADHQRIRKISGGVITTVAGNGTQGFSGDNGPATSAQLSNPTGIAVDGLGSIYIADSGNDRVRKVLNGVISTAAGGGLSSGDNGPATSAQVGSVQGVAIDESGNPYLTTYQDDQVKRLVATTESTVGCVYSIDSTTQTIGSGGGNASVGVLASASSCPWLASSFSTWITVNPSSVATGTGLVTYSVTPNPDSASRTGTIWIAGISLTVVQSGVACSLAASPRSVSVASSGLTGANLTVTSNAPDCTWTAAASAPWILVSGGNTGAGSGTVTYTVGINTGALRTGAISVAGQTVYVNQAAAGASISSLASIATDGIVNGASNSAPIAPGSFVTIYGENLSDSVTDWSSAITNGALPTSLGGVQAIVNGKNAFISYVQPSQVNILTQPDTAVGSVEVDVITNHGTVPTTVNMASVSPALFTYDLQGTLYASAQFATDYAYVAAVGAIPGTTSRPAGPGDYIVLYATGLGNTNPAYPVGQVLTSAYPVSNLSQVSVSIGGQPASVLFAGLVYAGVFQVNIQVPANVPAGNQTVTLGIAGQPSQQSVFLTFGQ